MRTISKVTKVTKVSQESKSDDTMWKSIVNKISERNHHLYNVSNSKSYYSTKIMQPPNVQSFVNEFNSSYFIKYFISESFCYTPLGYYLSRDEKFQRDVFTLLYLDRIQISQEDSLDFINLLICTKWTFKFTPKEISYISSLTEKQLKTLLNIPLDQSVRYAWLLYEILTGLDFPDEFFLSHKFKNDLTDDQLKYVESLSLLDVARIYDHISPSDNVQYNHLFSPFYRAWQSVTQHNPLVPFITKYEEGWDIKDSKKDILTHLIPDLSDIILEYLENNVNTLARQLGMSFQVKINTKSLPERIRYYFDNLRDYEQVLTRPKSLPELIKRNLWTEYLKDGLSSLDHRDDNFYNGDPSSSIEEYKKVRKIAHDFGYGDNSYSIDSFISLYSDFEIIKILSEMGNRHDVWIDRKDIVLDVYITMFRRDVPGPEGLDID